MRGSTAAAVAMSLLLLSCGDETTINNTLISNAGTIIGLLAPPDPGAAVFTEDSVYSTTTDEDGQFTLTGVQPGIYSLEVRPIQYSFRKLPVFKIAPNQLVDLGEITLSEYPYPIYMTVPPNGLESIRPNFGGFQIYIDEPLNFEDLQAGSRITPPVSGHWTEFILPYPFAGLRSNYEFVPDNEYLALSTRYELEIDPTVRTKEGVPLGHGILVEFMTEALKVRWIQPRTGYDDKVGLTDFRARIAFNAPIDINSLNEAAHFEPALEGIWIGESSPSVTTFLPTQPNSLKGSTTYRLIVSNSVGLSDGVALSLPDTMRFDTEPYRVESVDPCNGCSSNGYGLVRIDFNTAMDTASVESAFSFGLVDGPAMPGDIEWRSSHRVMLFWAWDRSLELARVYKITLPRSVLTADGQTLQEDLESYFTTDDY